MNRRKTPELLFTQTAENDWSEPNPDIVISCVRTQRKNHSECAVSDAATQLENRSFVISAAVNTA